EGGELIGGVAVTADPEGRHEVGGDARQRVVRELPRVRRPRLGPAPGMRDERLHERTRLAEASAEELDDPAAGEGEWKVRAGTALPLLHRRVDIIGLREVAAERVVRPAADQAGDELGPEAEDPAQLDATRMVLGRLRGRVAAGHDGRAAAQLAHRQLR